MNRNSLLVIAVLAIVGACLGIVSAESVAPQSPAEDAFDSGIEIEPMQVLTPEERQKAIDIVLFDSKVKDLLDGKKYEIDYVEYMPPMNGQDTHACVEIFLPDESEDGSFIMVLVNLDEKTVLEVITIVEDMREATPEERQKAIDIALSNSKVKDLLDGKEYEIDYVECLPSMNGQDMYASLDIFITDASEVDLHLIQVLVNMDEKKVVDVMPIQMDGYISLPEPEPLTPEEEKQVTDIALLDPTVKELLKGRAYNVSEVFVYAMPENERCAAVNFYIPDMSANKSAYMTVDVNLNESVVEYLCFEMFPEFQEDDSWSMSNDSVTGWITV